MKYLVLICLFTLTFNGLAQEKIMVSEDTFIQGGPSADIAMGATVPKNIRIFNSNANSKYARIGYLKFNLSKKIKTVKNVRLCIPLKVYKSAKNPTGKFELEVMAIENDNWSENSITWNDALTLGKQLGAISVSQATNGKNQLLTIQLDVAVFNSLILKKDTTVSLALTNTNFNKVNAMAPSKEQSKRVAAYLLINE
ncbi:MAG: DNRLRE domain-containing protein [Flavobacteriaceae bacterium]|nr:DNRLRE domain-containing protein [Flavobacteriaceae bacterium]